MGISNTFRQSGELRMPCQNVQREMGVSGKEALVRLLPEGIVDSALPYLAMSAAHHPKVPV